MSEYITPVQIPSYLLSTYISTMQYDTPYYVTADYIYVRKGTGELFLRSDEVLSHKAQSPKKMLGKIGLMRVALGNTITLTTGYVADIRHADSRKIDLGFYPAPAAEAPDDTEAANAWRKRVQKLVPLAAIAYTDTGDEQKGIQVVGMSNFTDAALHLAKLTDELLLNNSSLAQTTAKGSVTAPRKDGPVKRMATWLGL